MSAPHSQPESHECTRDRILAVAREVFSECGFKGATVREICRRAEVNVAAVNYHFSSKEALFMAALSFEPLIGMIAADNSAGSAKARLTHFIQEFTTRLMTENGTPQSQLMMRELIEPSLALDSIVKEVIAPLHEHLTRLVRDVVGDGISADELRRCVFSILGQCSFYRHSTEVNRRLYPELRFDPKEIEATARHITEFSLAGLGRIARK